MIKVGIGQDSHRFLEGKSDKKCIIGGVIFDEVPGWDADSDGDIVYHAICNAISSISHVPSLGGFAIRMCHEEKITDSRCYLEKACQTLHHHSIIHVALTIEAARPKLQKHIDTMRKNVAEILQLQIGQVGITCTSGDGLTDFGKGIGGQCFCIITVQSFDNQQD